MPLQELSCSGSHQMNIMIKKYWMKVESMIAVMSTYESL